MSSVIQCQEYQSSFFEGKRQWMIKLKSHSSNVILACDSFYSSFASVDLWMWEKAANVTYDIGVHIFISYHGICSVLCCQHKKKCAHYLLDVYQFTTSQQRQLLLLEKRRCQQIREWNGKAKNKSIVMTFIIFYLLKIAAHLRGK